MICIKLVFLITGCLILGIKCEVDECGSPEDLCPDDFLDLVKNLRTMLPEEDFLDKNCDNVLQTLDCLLDYNRTCGSERIGPRPMVKLLQASRNVVEKVCDSKSALGKGYRENVHCVNTLKDDFLSTVERININMTDYMKFLTTEKPGFQQNKESSHVFCLGFSLLAADASRMIEASCGEEAKETTLLFTREFMEGCPPHEEMAPYEQLYRRFISQS